MYCIRRSLASGEFDRAIFKIVTSIHTTRSLFGAIEAVLYWYDCATSVAVVKLHDKHAATLMLPASVDVTVFDVTV
jgi:hypothetical protein